MRNRILRDLPRNYTTFALKHTPNAETAHPCELTHKKVRETIAFIRVREHEGFPAFAWDQLPPSIF